MGSAQGWVYRIFTFEGFMPCLEEFYARTDITPAAFHPKSLIDDVLATCRFEGAPPRSRSIDSSVRSPVWT